MSPEFSESILLYSTGIGARVARLRCPTLHAGSKTVKQPDDKGKNKYVANRMIDIRGHVVLLVARNAINANWNADPDVLAVSTWTATTSGTLERIV